MILLSGGQQAGNPPGEASVSPCALQGLSLCELRGVCAGGPIHVSVNQAGTLPLLSSLKGAFLAQAHGLGRG